MLLSNNDIKKIILEDIPILDVRAPIEFNEGHIPNSICISILNDDERAQVGTTYKQKGTQKATELGHQLVNGKVKEERVKKWKKFLERSENSILTCFRGGLRSKTAQSWLEDVGIKRKRIEGGYKAYRQFILQEITLLTPIAKLIVVGGNTGSGKTEILRELKSKKNVLDLEEYAHHRGSAFGSLGAQPAQAIFENRLATELIKFNLSDKIIIEDESRLIGQCIQPAFLFENIRNSELVLVEQTLEERVENTFNEYIKSTALNTENQNEGLKIFEQYKSSLKKISNRLGGLRFEEIMKDILHSQTEWLKNKNLESNKIWISKLLQFYYDPMYTDSLNRRKPKVLFRGTKNEVQEYLKEKAPARHMQAL